MKTTVLATVLLVGCGGTATTVTPPVFAPGSLGGACDDRLCDPPLASAYDTSGHCRCVDARHCGVPTTLTYAPEETHVCCFFNFDFTDAAGFCAQGACQDTRCVTQETF